MILKSDCSRSPGQFVAVFVSGGCVLLSLLCCRPAGAQNLELDQVQRQALAHSYTMKIAGSDIALQKIAQQEAISLYYPTLSLRYDLGYAWGLDGQSDTVTIGDSVSTSDLSVWRNSFSTSGSLLLYDGGAREQKVLQAKYGLQASELAQTGQSQQVRLQVLEAYVDGLQAQTRLVALRRIHDRRKGMFRALERLQVAGTVGRERLQSAALDLAAGLTRLDDALAVWCKALSALTTLTGESYLEAETSLAELPMPERGVERTVAIEKLPQIQVFDAEMAQLRAERSAAWRSMFPAVGVYGNYRFYGSDPDRGGAALRDLQPRDATVAMVVEWQFSGFRDQLQVNRLDEQMRRLNWQRQQRMAELEQELGGLSQSAEQFDAQLTHLMSVQQATSAVKQATDRLRDQELIDEPEALERAIDLLERGMNADLLRNRQQADVLRLQIWQEGLGG